MFTVIERLLLFKIKAVGIRHITQLSARRVAGRILKLDDIGAHPRE